jgi:hypothetical protein
MPANERVNLFALAGVLALLLPRSRPKLKDTLKGQSRHLQRSREEVAKYTFVPAYFALAGMSLLFGTSDNFSPATCISLLWEAEKYAEKGPAIEFLRAEVKRYLGRR